MIEKAIHWLENSVFSVQTFLEIAIIIGALFVGWLVRGFIGPKLIILIEKINLPYHVTRALKNSTKLLLHIIAVLLLLVAAQLTQLEFIPFKGYWIEATAKLLAVWIFIRIAAQFIANNLIRNVVATIAWSVAALSILGVLDDTMAGLDWFGFEIGDFRLSLLSIIQSVLGIVLFVWIAIFVSNVVERRLNKTKEISVTARVLINKIIKFTLITVAIIIGITSAGINLSVFAVFGGALGLGVGFGLQKGVSNLFSGILLLLDRSIKPGDIIEIQQSNTFGWVEQMGARYTNIVTRDNKSYLVPNEDLITQQVVNWSHGNTLVRLEIRFGVHYDSDPHLIKKIAPEAAATLERVVDEPKPVCHITEFGDSSVNFTLRFWIKDAEKGVTNIRGDVFLSLWEAFKQHNIQIPYPHREVFMRQA